MSDKCYFGAIPNSYGATWDDTAAISMKGHSARLSATSDGGPCQWWMRIDNGVIRRLPIPPGSGRARAVRSGQAVLGMILGGREIPAPPPPREPTILGTILPFTFCLGSIALAAQVVMSLVT